MLQSQAKVTLELDVEGAKKQLADMKGELDNTAGLTKQKIRDNTEDAKKEEKKETDRQQSLLPQRLNQIRQAFFDPNTPTRIVGGLTGLIPEYGPQLAGVTSAYFQNSDNIKVLAKFTEEVIKKLPVLGITGQAFGAGLVTTEKLLPADVIRDIKSKWESISKTTEDTMSAYAGVFTGGHKPSAGAMGTQISRLYEFNAAQTMLNKNRRLLQLEVIGTGVLDTIFETSNNTRY